MKTLNYETLREQGYGGYLLPQAPERVLQFGEGNFLRAFVDYFVDIANEKVGFDSKVVVVQPIAQGGLAPFFEQQQGLYTLYLRGRENGETVNEKRVVSSIGRYLNPYDNYAGMLACALNPDLRYIVSNTTEAGIAYDAGCRYDNAPPTSFPAKLTRFLHERWKAGGRGLVVLSCELIDNNGKELQSCVCRHCADWSLEPDFLRWLEEECLFCSTLVDRIVTGYPRAEIDGLNAENGYVDHLADTAESFGLWVIEGPQWLAEELPFARAGLPVKVVADHSPYKKQKVRILNGAHTCMVPAAFLCGREIVRDCMFDEDIRRYLRKLVWEEIIPVVPLPKTELEGFANAVMERFENPFIDHELLAITLNCTSKWRARVLPTLKEGLAATKALPPCLTFSLAAYIAFYTGSFGEDGVFYGDRDGERYPIQDDSAVLEFFAAHSGEPAEELAQRVLANVHFWGEDLTALPGLSESVAESLQAIRGQGMRAALRGLL